MLPSHLLPNLPTTLALISSYYRKAGAPALFPLLLPANHLIEPATSYFHTSCQRARTYS